MRPKLHQHVTICSTIGDNSLDKVYSNIKLGYRAKSFPHLRLLDHLSLLLIPAYAPLRNTTPIITKSVKSWPDGASHQLQECFDRTNWDVVAYQDLEVFTDSVNYAVYKIRFRHSHRGQTDLSLPETEALNDLGAPATTETEEHRFQVW